MTFVVLTCLGCAFGPCALPFDFGATVITVVFCAFKCVVGRGRFFEGSGTLCLVMTLKMMMIISVVGKEMTVCGGFCGGCFLFLLNKVTNVIFVIGVYLCLSS